MHGEISRAHWFDEARFGIFIHWGLYSIWGRGEWFLFKERVPLAQYNQLADAFVPASFDARAWVALAKRAGARYVVLTARHHDGFALFDSAASDFTSVKRAARRDFIREYVVACREAGLKVGIYFSLMSWQFPAASSGPRKDPDGWEAMVRQTHAQVRELMTQYGQIDLLWYDGCVVPGIGDPLVLRKFWRSQALNAMVRKLQPGILINDRAALPEDFATPEQETTAPARGRRWEACMTLNGSWGYNQDDTAFKSVNEILRHLVHCASHGGNLLLNIGPLADGSVPEESASRLEGIGAWMRVNGEAILKSTRTPFGEATHLLGPATTRDGRIYFHLFDWPGGDAALAGIGGALEAARILGGPAVAVAPQGVGVWTARALPAASMSDEGGPAVLRLDSRAPAHALRPATILGGEIPVKELTSHSPILAPRTGRHDPDCAPLLSARAVLDSLAAGCTARLEAGGGWCPGWTGRAILAPPPGATLAFHLDVPADGCYDLNLGVLARQATLVRLRIDGVPCVPARRLRIGGYPDTVVFAKLALRQGRRLLGLETAAAGPFGLYALRLAPRWRPLPSELWRTIGPFPTGWNVHAPLSEVKAALLQATPAEGVFDPEQRYAGAEGQALRWTWTPLRRGARASQGVDFPNRCGIAATGLCLARTVIESPVARDLSLLIGCDWWANAILNGRLVPSTRDAAATAADGAAFNGWKPTPATLQLRQGKNTLLVKCHPGSTANWFTCFVNDPGDLKIE